MIIFKDCITPAVLRLLYWVQVINENEDIDYDDLAAIFLEEDEPEIYELQVSDIEVENSQFKYSRNVSVEKFGNFK